MHIEDDHENALPQLQIELRVWWLIQVVNQPLESQQSDEFEHRYRLQAYGILIILIL